MDTRTTSLEGPTKKVFLLINRNFALLWSGQVISMIGDFAFSITLTLWVATQIGRGQVWTPLAMSGILLAASIPVFIIGPAAGVFVDRWDRRRTMLWMDVVRVVLILSLLLATGIVPLPITSQGHLSLVWQLGLIYSVVFLESTCAQFFNPSRFALIGAIVEKVDQGRASGLTQLPESLAFLVGPLLGTLLFFAVGVQWALILNALSFGISFLTVLAVRIPQASMTVEGASEQQSGFFREFIEGISFLMGQRVLRTLLISSILLTLNEGVLNTLEIFFVTGNLHTSASLYGLLSTDFGIGFILGAVLASRFLQLLNVARYFWLVFVAEGIVILIYARLTNFLPALLMMFLFGILVGIVNSVIMLLTLQVTRQELLGRVMAVRTPITTLALMLSAALAGYLDSTLLRNFHTTILNVALGPVDSIFTLTGLLAIVGGLYAMIDLRHVIPAIRLDEE